MTLSKTEYPIEKVPLTAAAPFASPAFVVWKGTKPRVVVDMRRLNTKVIPNAYPLPRQDDIPSLSSLFYSYLRSVGSD